MHGQLDVVKDTCVPTYRLQSGDSVVLEAHQLLTSVHMHSNHFALMRTVQDSQPPITDSALDQYVLRAHRSSPATGPDILAASSC
jgi:hypothetical protein